MGGGADRLPKFAKPINYHLHLKPDLIACKFTGAVEIQVNVVLTTTSLVLNAVDLDVDSSSITFNPHASSQELRPVGVELIAEDEIMVIEFANELPLGVGVLKISFVSTLNDQMKGFYASVYEVNGEKKNMAVTQFEAVDARRCFPCWDEPAAKASFKLSLDVPSELIALSNMPVVEEEVHGDVKTVHFEESPVMSTYLVAIVVGLFDYLESYTSDGIKVRCYCEVGKANQGKFALDVAVKALELYKKYFDTPYPLPKLDMVAIPDFAAGAMENFGLVTYREADLLYDEQNSSATDKQEVTVTVAHELAHQWFGNLVTMEWWTHLWLNEGFATWMSYLAIDSLFPEWRIWIHFLAETGSGLRLDALAESHPIEVEIKHAQEIDEIFDDISYSKGASLIQMLQGYVGADRFQKGLALYIKRYAYSNAKTEDLWAALEEESGEPIKDLMPSWTKQKGYPVISVKLNNQTLEVDQSHFLFSGSSGDSMWIVPITLCCGSYDGLQTFLLRSKTGTIEVKGSGWIKVNVEQKGFYRVKYDEKLTAKLQSAIESNHLSATDRFGVLDDANALCISGLQTLASVLTLMGSFKEELDYTVYSKLIDISSQVWRIVADAAPEMVSDIKKFFISLFQKAVETLGWEPRQGESQSDAMLRGAILIALAKLGHDATLNEAIKRFHSFLNDKNSSLLPPDIRKAAYVAVMQKVTVCDKSGYESLLKIYRETDLSQEKERILGSLASCPDPDIVLEVLNFLLSSEVRSQDAIIGLRISIEGRETAWKWLKDSWNYISKVWGSGTLMSRFVKAIVSPFSSLEMLKEVEEFFASRTTPNIAMTLKQSIESIQINARWVQNIRNEQGLSEALHELALGVC